MYTKSSSIETRVIGDVVVDVCTMGVDTEVVSNFYKFACNIAINSEASYCMAKTTLELLFRCCNQLMHDYEVLIDLHEYLKNLISSYESGLSQG